jgi:hypothetical protein
MLPTLAHTRQPIDGQRVTLLAGQGALAECHTVNGEVADRPANGPQAERELMGGLGLAALAHGDSFPALVPLTGGR